MSILKLTPKPRKRPMLPMVRALKARAKRSTYRRLRPAKTRSRRV